GRLAREVDRTEDIQALLVALQVVPAGEDHPAIAVEARAEGAAGRVVEDAQRARRGLKAVDAGDGRRALVLVQLRVQVRFAAARAIGGEQDAVVAGVQRRDVVVRGRLVGDLGDARGLATGQTGDFVELPLGIGVLVLAGRSAHDHAEDRLVAAPVHGRLAHGDRVGALQA